MVSGAGDIKLTKDGNVLLHEMVGNTDISLVLLFIVASSHYTANSASHCITHSSCSYCTSKKNFTCDAIYSLPTFFVKDDITGDGTTSNVLIIGELLKQSDLYISEGLHPRIVSEGFEKAKEKALEVNPQFHCF